MFNYLRVPGYRRPVNNDDELSPMLESAETSRHRRDTHTAGRRGTIRQTSSSYFSRTVQERADGSNLQEHANRADSGNNGGDADEDENEDEDEDEVDAPLLPIFSAAHLDRLPLYNITHAIRILIVQRCETTLSWEQLRSPQVSQFLVKPIQSQIRTNHFNKATLCALIANCLQFHKECQITPANVGVLRTRALTSELLAMRLIKEYTVRELIDALSYDFNPLQGLSTHVDSTTPTWQASANLQDQTVRKAGRVSCIEVAIKAQAKRFLAHPSVVQHLEAIWAGTIVFHADADNLHRKKSTRATNKVSQSRGRTGYGTMAQTQQQSPTGSAPGRKARESRTTHKRPPEPDIKRRAVTLYNPREASLFKLSRLRVPRYRQLFSTTSFAIMLMLYIAVLVDRSLDITPLEVLFWVWSIGYMLDEVIGFTEQGFGLYILSFWNAFDLGILLLFVVYYALRLYGIVLAEEGKHRIASMSYDVLASTAVLLFPRLFSVLDHYRYFSQLLIAFRMMAQDLFAILVLIVISCSGFFVAFTLSFSDDDTDGSAVAYALFQLLMGFTPAAWEKWASFNVLGKIVMTLFLIICHFLIVTILITVLTNSFMAIVQNASEEHQFLFAVNTLSMVKSDMLFSYIPPFNVIGWLLSPLRYVMPFRQFIKLNRTIIKLTHFPVLWTICCYERVVLAKVAYEPVDLVQQPLSKQRKPLAFSINKVPDLFSPGQRLREPSVVSFQKDRALDEVFRRPFRGSTVRTTTRDLEIDRGDTSNVVDKWMQQADDQGGASPPQDQPRSVVEKLEYRRHTSKRAANTSDRPWSARRNRKVSSGGFSAASDPDRLSTLQSTRPKRIAEENEAESQAVTSSQPQETDADGDQETNDESDTGALAFGESAVSIVGKENRTPADDTGSEDDFFHTPVANKSPITRLSNAGRLRLQQAPSSALLAVQNQQGKRRSHERNNSSATIMFAPQLIPVEDSSASNQRRLSKHSSRRQGSSGSALGSAPGAIRLSPGTKLSGTPVKRPGMITGLKTAPNIHTTRDWHDLQRVQRQPSFMTRALDLASEIGDNKWAHNGFDAGGLSGMPASFSEQMMRERDLERRREDLRRRSEEEETGMVSRIMLARMHTLEEGFREVLREIKDMSQQASSSRRDSEVNLAQIRSPAKRGPATSRGSTAQHSRRHSPKHRSGGTES